MLTSRSLRPEFFHGDSSFAPVPVRFGTNFTFTKFSVPWKLPFAADDSSLRSIPSRRRTRAQFNFHVMPSMMFCPISLHGTATSSVQQSGDTLTAHFAFVAKDVSRSVVDFCSASMIWPFELIMRCHAACAMSG